jgi:protein pelota
MRLAGSKKAMADLADLGGTEEDVVSLLPEEPEDMVKHTEMYCT